MKQKISIEGGGTLDEELHIDIKGFG